MGARTALVAMVVAVMGVPGTARGDRTIHVKVTEVPYRPVRAFLDLHFDIGPQSATLPSGVSDDGRHIAFGLGVMSARRTHMQLVTDMTWRRVELDGLGVSGLREANLFELLIGGRLYPLKPTFGAGSLAVRVTASASGGIVLKEGGQDLALLLSAGLSFSFGDDPSALKVEVVYRPISTDSEYSTAGGDAGRVDIEPSVGARLSFLFGP